MEILRRASEQAPGDDGVARTRFAIIRSSYPELKSTTIKSWKAWLPENNFGKIKYDSPISQVLSFFAGSKKIESEILFLPMRNEDDIAKLRGMELTGAWMNEAQYLPLEVLNVCNERCGRYPAGKHGKPTWDGVILDTNPPDDDHWVYKTFIENSGKSYEIFQYQGAMVNHEDKWVINPDAIDYINNLEKKEKYYEDIIQGQSDDWIRVNVGGQFGHVSTGRVVYNEFSDNIHIHPVAPVKGVEMFLAWDFGLTPACLVCQLTPNGKLLVLEEFQAMSSGIKSFAENVVMPHLLAYYPDATWTRGVADPAGIAKSQHDDRFSCIGTLNEIGKTHEAFFVSGSLTQKPVERQNAVRGFLSRLIDGEPAILIDPKCKILRKGFNGGYIYKRIAISGSHDRFADEPDKSGIYSHLQDCLQYAAVKCSPRKKAENNNAFLSSLAAGDRMSAFG